MAQAGWLVGGYSGGWVPWCYESTTCTHSLHGILQDPSSSGNWTRIVCASTAAPLQLVWWESNFRSSCAQVGHQLPPGNCSRSNRTNQLPPRRWWSVRGCGVALCCCIRLLEKLAKLYHCRYYELIYFHDHLHEIILFCWLPVSSLKGTGNSRFLFRFNGNKCRPS